jgi:hypothetical protein
VVGLAKNHNNGPRRRSITASIARISNCYGPDDPRLPGLRKQLGAERSLDELRAWAQRAATSLAPFDEGEIETVAAVVRQLDIRLSQRPKPRDQEPLQLELPPTGRRRRVLRPGRSTELKQRILRAVEANPELSNRAIGRLIGCDHSTVGQYRGYGMSPFPPGDTGAAREARHAVAS